MNENPISEKCMWRVAIDLYPYLERQQELRCVSCQGYRVDAEKIQCNAYTPYERDTIDLWDENRMLHRPNDYEDGV
jgi:hypothetical protein